MQKKTLKQKIQSAKNIPPQKKEELLLILDILPEKQKKKLQLTFLAEDFFETYGDTILQQVRELDRKYRKKILQTAEKLSS